MLEEIYDMSPSDLLTRPFNSEEMPAVVPNGPSTFLSTSVDCLVNFRCLWSQLTHLSFREGQYWNTSKIQRDYAADKISVDGGPWTSTIKGPREEYLIDLHTTGDDWCRTGTLTWWLMTPWTISPATQTATSSTLKSASTSLNLHLLTTYDLSTINEPTASTPDSSPQQSLVHDEEPAAVSGPSPTSCLNLWPSTTRRRFSGREWWIASCTSTTREWSNFGKSMLVRAISARLWLWRNLAMRSQPLTSTHVGTLRKLIIDVSSPDYSAEYLLTWRGWHHHAQCGAHCRIWLHEQLHACSVKEIIKNRFMWSSPVEFSRNSVMKTEMPLLNGPIERFPGGLPALKRWLKMGTWHGSRRSVRIWSCFTCLLTSKGVLGPIRKPTTWVCLGGHHHLPIEGSSPMIGNRAHLATAIDTYLHSKHGEIAYATSDLPATEQPPPSLAPQMVPFQLPDHLRETPDPAQSPEKPQPTQRGILHRLSPSTNLSTLKLTAQSRGYIAT